MNGLDYLPAIGRNDVLQKLEVNADFWRNVKCLLREELSLVRFCTKKDVVKFDIVLPFVSVIFKEVVFFRCTEETCKKKTKN